MKLIELSDTHYIVVDDSEKEVGDLYFNTNINKILRATSENIDAVKLFKHCKKITHSTEPLIIEHTFDNDLSKYNGLKERHLGVKLLSLSEVEEAIYGYSVEKMAENHLTKVYNDEKKAKEYLKSNDAFTTKMYISYIEGFKTHQELVKDKLFTIEDMRKYHNIMCLYGNTKGEEYIQSLLPKTEWEVEFDEQGKIKLVE